MLNAHFYLLSCDEFDFFESTDSKISRTWLFSLKHVLNEMNFSADAYPEGSLTGNRIYIELTIKFLFADDEELNEFKQKIFNFLSHRRDDESYNNSYLFGSTYDVIIQNASKNVVPQKIVSIGLRHSISALSSILLLTDKYSTHFTESLYATNKAMSKYLNKNSEWKNDRYKFLTLASFINLFKRLNLEPFSKTIQQSIIANYNKCLSVLINDTECIKEKIDGSFEFYIPDDDDPFKYHKSFFISNALVLVPELQKEKKIQSVVKGFIKNSVTSSYGLGVPLFTENQNKSEKPKPDFGITSAILYLLWYSIENEIGNGEWIEYCKSYFEKYLSFCLMNFDNIDSYIFPLSENHSKILFLPLFSQKPDLQIRKKIKKALHQELTRDRSIFKKEFKKLDMEIDYNIICEIVESWEIRKNIKKLDKKYRFSENLHILTGEFLGAFYKTYSS